MRRILAATIAATIGLSLAPVAPAAAQQSEPPASITIGSPADGATFAGHETSPITFTATAREGRRITRIRAQLSGPGASQTVCDDSYGEDAPQVVEASFSWHTSRTPSGAVGCTSGGAVPVSGLAANGTWQLTVTVTSIHLIFGAQPDVTATRSLSLAHPPSTPAGLALKHDPGKREITVSWSANPEPDIKGYRVQECFVASGACSPKAWEQLVDTSRDTTSIAVKTGGPGIYRYRVAALREGTDQASGWQSVSKPASVRIDEDEPEPEPTGTDEPTGPTGEGEVAAPPPPPPTQPRPVVLPRRVQRSAPQVVQRIVDEDRGFDETLPYQGTSSGGEDDSDGDEAQGRRPLAGSESGDDQRAILIPLAGGFLFLMIAGHLWYLNRRSAMALVTMEPEGDFDWSE